MASPWYIDQLHLTMRLLLALVLGGLIGFEREKNAHAAGFRTHILVCLGSALIMLLSIYGFSAFTEETNVRIDPARLAAQVISGIGFLGAGTILRHGLTISGLTTAASLWVVAAIGLSVGAGFYFASILVTTLVLISLWALHIVERKYFRNRRIRLMKITAIDQPGSLGLISSILNSKGIEIRKVLMEEEGEGDEEKKIIISLSLKFPRANLVPAALDEIRNIQGVSGVGIE